MNATPELDQLRTSLILVRLAIEESLVAAEPPASGAYHPRQAGSMKAVLAVLTVGTFARAQDGGLPESQRLTMLDARLMASQRAQLERLREQLNEPLAPEACERARVFRAIYKPSFTLPSVVTLELSPTHARLWLRAPARMIADGGVETQQTEAELAPEVSGALLEKLTSARPRDLEDQPSTGTDGIGLMGTVCAPGEPAHHFVGWDYKPSRRLDWFRAVIDTARASLPIEGSFAAERTLEYLAPPGELIRADDPGPPRTIRLVAISLSEAEPFRALISCGSSGACELDPASGTGGLHSRSAREGLVDEGAPQSDQGWTLSVMTSEEADFWPRSSHTSSPTR